MADHNQIMSWLGELALRCAPTKANATEETITTRCFSYAKALPRHLPSAAFCNASLEAMAEKFDFFPAYKELLEAMQDWVGRNRPAARAISDEGAPQDPQRWAAIWHALAERRGDDSEQQHRRNRVNHLALIRVKAPEVYQHLLKIDAEAHQIAAQLRFPAASTLEQDRTIAKTDWADPGKVLLSVRGILDPPHPQGKFLLGLLHSIVARHAPQNVGLVPLSPP